jgi:Uma2 family endonuclease
MATAFSSSIPSVLPSEWTFSDVHRHLGEIPLNRIRAVPPPGPATEKDVLEAKDRFGRVCELWDGVLVEKPMGYYESLVAIVLAARLWEFVRQHALGFVLGEQGIVRILPGQIRAADVAFVSWRHIPDRELPPGQVLAAPPDLMVEVLSPGNTVSEMDRKLREYFQAGVRLVWLIDAAKKTAVAYRSEHDAKRIAAEGSLDGEDVLPGFALPLAELFEEAGKRKG